MKMITGICGVLLISGLVAGWWLLGDFSGSAVGLFLAACLAIPLDCLASQRIRA